MGGCCGGGVLTLALLTLGAPFLNEGSESNESLLSNLKLRGFFDSCVVFVMNCVTLL